MTVNEIKKRIKEVRMELNTATGMVAVKLEQQLETLLFLKSIKSA